MKKIHLTILLTGLLALSMIGLSACDDMTGVSDKTANQSISSQEVQGVVNTAGETTAGVAGIWIDNKPIGPFQLSAEELDEGYDVPITGWTGFFTRTDNPENPKLTKLELEVNKDGEENEGELVWNEINLWDSTPLGSIVLTTRDDKPGREFNGVFVTPSIWKIYEIGSYTIRATAVFTGPFADAVDTETVVVTDFQVDVEFPAAPAIAARILEANEEAARYGSGRTGGNYIADVAHNMGTGTDFDGIPKELWVDDEKAMNQAYWDAVWDFLEGAPYYLDLPNKPEGYIW